MFRLCDEFVTFVASLIFLIMKKLILIGALSLCFLGASTIAQNRNDKEKKKVECCCEDCSCEDCVCGTDCSECTGCTKNAECKACVNCEGEERCCNYDKEQKCRRHHHRRSGCCGRHC